ncbi:carbohydrate ABC transporter permease [Salinisphaera sp. SWV1]|uniref:carbohydrate ABC transporter permease n=1 Tax=Salinisphaera sp. SWV1 TaxID=3454139 RepID=UPI003F856687
MNNNRFADNKAWFLVLPATLLVAFSSLIPFIAVVNYSLQIVFNMSTHSFIGWSTFHDALTNEEFRGALGRQVLFTAIVLAIEVPLGIGVALTMPRSGRAVGPIMVVLALPLLVPWNVVGLIWQIFARGDIGLFGAFVNNVLHINYNYATGSLSAWFTVVLMSVWHWTSLIALLCYAGLCAIPGAFYQAARIDGASRWAVFRFIELPKLRGVLTIAILLRFVYSFKVYAEPLTVTGGGPGSSTTFMTEMLTNTAIGQFAYGKAAAYGLLYFLIILLISYVFYIVLTRVGTSDGGQ